MVYGVWVFRARDYTLYFYMASTFFALSIVLSVFWNFELYNRNLGFAIISTVIGPISRNLFVEIMPASSRHTMSDRYNQRDNDVLLEAFSLGWWCVVSVFLFVSVYVMCLSCMSVSCVHFHVCVSLHEYRYMACIYE